MDRCDGDMTTGSSDEGANMTQASRQHSPGTVLVTGASSGIGLEFATLLAKQGYDLVLVARNHSSLVTLAERLRDEHAVRVDVFATDLSISTAADHLFNQLQEQNVAVNVLINDAGFAIQGEFVESDKANLLDMLQVNVVALTQLPAPFCPIW